MLTVMRARLGHVSNERLLSGQGLLNLAQSLAVIEGRTTQAGTAEEVTEAARVGSCPACVEAVTMFSALLGAAAGDLALAVGARGGVYVAGGVCLGWAPCSTAPPSAAASSTRAGCAPFWSRSRLGLSCAATPA